MNNIKRRQALGETLGYTFKNHQLLETALTHRSQADPINNERLEFLGDAVIGLIISEMLFQQPIQLSEGQLSRFRATLVNRTALANLAKNLHIGSYLKLGKGELCSGGQKRLSILSNAMEAIIGAIYLDAGLDTCKARISFWLGDKVKTLSQNQINLCKDPKSLLQERLQANKHPLPTYTVLSIKGEKHAQIFEVSCSVTGLSHQTVGIDRTRARAEQSAAQKYLDHLHQYLKTID